MLDIAGDKWSLLVIRDLFLGKSTFGSFLKSSEKISTSVLSIRLNQLQHAGIVKYLVSKKDKKVKFYYLTDRGIDLYPVLYEMMYWSKRNFDEEYHPVVEDWYKKYNGQPAEFAIEDNQKNYTKLRSELLDSKEF